MQIGDRLKRLREQKDFSQGDIENKTGMIRAYISRVENGHTVPSISTLEKFARALDLPLYALFYDGEKPPVAPKTPSLSEGFGSTRREARAVRHLQRCLARMTPSDRELLLGVAEKMAGRKH